MYEDFDDRLEADGGAGAGAAERLPAGGVPAPVGTSPRRESPADPDAGLRRARIAVVAATVLVLAAIGIACWRYVPQALAWLADAGAVRAFVAEHAVLSRLAMVGINMLQVILAFLPGEPIELASGYAFGFLEGTLLCLAASALARSLIYWTVRAWGWRVVGLFFDRSHLERFRWLQDARRVELAMFVVFLIPGTPKDFLTYFAGLTRMRYPAVLLISTVGTIPSVATSTAAASAFGSGDYGLAIAVVAVAAVLLAAGTVLYRRHMARTAGR